MRFIAASLVIADHTSQLFAKVGRGDIWENFNFGGIGVDLFFCISGFIMVYITKSREKSTPVFLVHRVARVVPPYWIATFLMVSAIVLQPRLFNTAKLDLHNLFASLLMIAWPNPGWPDAVPTFFPGWTLNYEMFFYLIFSAFLQRSVHVKILGPTLVFASLILVGRIFTPNAIIRFYCNPIIIEFTFGMLTALFLEKMWVPNRQISILFVSAGVILAILAAIACPISRVDPLRFCFWGIPASLMVTGCVFLEVRGILPLSKALKRLGDASYAAYLTHFFVVGVIGQIWRFLHLSNYFSDLFLLIFGFASAWLGALVFHNMFEKPSTKFALRQLTKLDLQRRLRSSKLSDPV